MFKKVIGSERLQKENPKLIGRYVQVGRQYEGWVYVRLDYREYPVLREELSKETYIDAFGTREN